MPAAALPRAFWPLTITSGNNKIDFQRASGIGQWANPAQVATVAAATYYSPAEIASALITAFFNVLGTYEFQWACRATDGRFNVYRTGSNGFRLLFGTGANATSSARSVLGFASSDYEVGVGMSTLYAPNQHVNGWYADRPPKSDTKVEYERQTASTVALGGQAKHLIFGDEKVLRSIDLAFLKPHKAKVAREGSYPNEAIERLWRDGHARFRWWTDANVDGTYEDYVLDDFAGFAPERQFVATELYRLRWKLRRYVA